MGFVATNMLAVTGRDGAGTAAADGICAVTGRAAALATGSLGAAAGGEVSLARGATGGVRAGGDIIEGDGEGSKVCLGRGEGEENTAAVVPEDGVRKTAGEAKLARAAAETGGVKEAGLPEDWEPLAPGDAGTRPPFAAGDGLGGSAAGFERDRLSRSISSWLT
jgi:hypothetical protein